MLSIFRTNQLILGVLLIPYAFLVRSYGWFKGIETDYDNGGLFYDMVVDNLPLNDALYFILGFCLILLQSFQANQIVNNHKMGGEVNLFPSLFYVLAGSASLSFLGFSPALLGNTFLLFALWQFSFIYQEKQPSGKIFNAGFFTGLAILSCSGYIAFLLFGTLAIIIQRAFTVKEVLQFLVGFLVPVFWTWVYFYYQGELDEGLWVYAESTLSILNFRLDFQLHDILAAGLLGVMILLVFALYPRITDKLEMKNKKNISLLYWFSVVGLISIIPQADVGMEHLIIFAIPLGGLLGIGFTKMKNQRWAEVIHLCLLILIPLGHYLLG